MTRQGMQRLLGSLWIFDGLLQFRPAMFSKGLVFHDIEPLIPNQPLWLKNLLDWEGHLVLSHLIVADAGIGVLQIFIGIALLNRRWHSISLSISLIWALGVWVFGEGLGQLLTGYTWLANGAPGAALLYAILSLGLMPQWQSKHRRRYFQIATSILWMGEGLLWQEPSIQRTFSHLPIFSFITPLTGLLISFAIAFLVLLPKTCNVAMVLGIAFSLVSWAFGEDFGQFWLPYATDINSGVPLAIIAYGMGIDHQLISLKATWESPQTSESISLRRGSR